MKPTPIIVISALVLLSACSEPKMEAAEPVRPVLSMVVRETTVPPPVFAGTVEARTETQLAFRVLGRMVNRPVEVGDQVAHGQLLASLDPVSLELTVQSARAQLSGAQASLANAEASLSRQRELFEQKTTSEAALEQAQQAYEAARASVAQAEANVAKAVEQLSYASLVATYDGIVREVSAEVGQNVSAGQPVVTLARLGERDVVLDVPDTALRSIEVGSPFETNLQLNPEIGATGKVREISPDADPATRTRRVKLTLDSPPEGYRLGSTVAAAPRQAGASAIRIPRSAVVQHGEGRPRVWVVDAASMTVSTVEVELGPEGGSHVEVRSGLEPGTRLVTAGVHSLAEGQAIKDETNDTNG